MYSWKLVKTDTVPKGAKDDISLREKEKLIQNTLDDEIIPFGGEMTVFELVKKYISQKAGVKHTIKENYHFYYGYRCNGFQANTYYGARKEIPGIYKI